MIIVNNEEDAELLNEASLIMEEYGMDLTKNSIKSLMNLIIDEMDRVELDTLEVKEEILQEIINQRQNQFTIKSHYQKIKDLQNQLIMAKLINDICIRLVEAFMPYKERLKYKQKYEEKLDWQHRIGDLKSSIISHKIQKKEVSKNLEWLFNKRTRRNRNQCNRIIKRAKDMIKDHEVNEKEILITEKDVNSLYNDIRSEILKIMNEELFIKINDYSKNELLSILKVNNLVDRDQLYYIVSSIKKGFETIKNNQITDKTVNDLIEILEVLLNKNFVPNLKIEENLSHYDIPHNIIANPFFNDQINYILDRNMAIRNLSVSHIVISTLLENEHCLNEIESCQKYNIDLNRKISSKKFIMNTLKKEKKKLVEKLLIIKRISKFETDDEVLPYNYQKLKILRQRNVK